MSLMKTPSLKLYYINTLPNDYSIVSHEFNSLNNLVPESMMIDHIRVRLHGLIINDYVPMEQLAGIIGNPFSYPQILALPFLQTISQSSKIHSFAIEYLDKLQEKGLLHPILLNSDFCIGANSFLTFSKAH